MKPKKYWITRDYHSDRIFVWTIKPELIASQNGYFLPKRYKKPIHFYTPYVFHIDEFKALFGKELARGGICPVSFTLEVLL